MKTPEELKKGLHICGSDELCEESNECPYYNNERCMSAMMADADAYILTLEADKAKLQTQNAELVKQVETQVPKWISAKEPPQEWRNDDRTLIKYLVYLPEYGVDVGNYLGQAETWVCMGLPCKVTHWMPLPEPPKEEKA